MRHGLAILILMPCLLGLRGCGEQIFRGDLSASAGFGPAYNGKRCMDCHFGPGIDGELTVGGNGVRYRSPVFVRVGQGEVIPYFRFGDPRPIPSDARIATRLAPPLGGLAEVEALGDAYIRINADPMDVDGDGISGRLGGVDSDGRIHRYGLQAHVGTLREFIARALAEEHGIDFTEQQETPAMVDALEEFVLSLPRPRSYEYGVVAPEEVPEGAALFEAIGCADCHVPLLATARLYSDLLLHDLGPSLDDGISLNAACQNAVPDDRHHTRECSPREFRTTSLRGVGHRLKRAVMHDGRARDLEMVVRLHGGEAADSRDAWLALSRGERHALSEFVKTL